MDFMHDQLGDQRSYRLFNVIDDFNREALCVEPSFSYPAEHVIRILEILASERGLPRVIRVDNGPEFLANSFKEFCRIHAVDIQYIQPGKPMQNGYIERFNRLVREEVLDAYLFNSLSQIRILCERLKDDYNANHPHQSLCSQSPKRFKYLYDKGMIYYDTVKAKMNLTDVRALTVSPQILIGCLTDIRSESVI